MDRRFDGRQGVRGVHLQERAERSVRVHDVGVQRGVPELEGLDFRRLLDGGSDPKKR